MLGAQVSGWGGGEGVVFSLPAGYGGLPCLCLFVLDISCSIALTGWHGQHPSRVAHQDHTV